MNKEQNCVAAVYSHDCTKMADTKKTSSSPQILIRSNAEIELNKF